MNFAGILFLRQTYTLTLSQGMITDATMFTSATPQLLITLMFTTEEVIMVDQDWKISDGQQTEM